MIKMPQEISLEQRLEELEGLDSQQIQESLAERLEEFEKIACEKEPATEEPPKKPVSEEVKEQPVAKPKLPTSQDILRHAETLYKKGQYADAIAYYDAIVQLEKGTGGIKQSGVAAIITKGTAFINLNNYEKAISAFDSAIQFLADNKGMVNGETFKAYALHHLGLAYGTQAKASSEKSQKVPLLEQAVENLIKATEIPENELIDSSRKLLKLYNAQLQEELRTEKAHKSKTKDIGSIAETLAPSYADPSGQSSVALKPSYGDTFLRRMRYRKQVLKEAMSAIGPFFDALVYTAGTLGVAYLFYRYNKENPLEGTKAFDNIRNIFDMGVRLGVAGYATSLINVGITKLRKVESAEDFFKTTFGTPFYSLPAAATTAIFGSLSYMAFSFNHPNWTMLPLVVGTVFALGGCNLTSKVHDNGFEEFPKFWRKM